MVLTRKLCVCDACCRDAAAMRFIPAFCFDLAHQGVWCQICHADVRVIVAIAKPALWCSEQCIVLSSFLVSVFNSRLQVCIPRAHRQDISMPMACSTLLACQSQQEEVRRLNYRDVGRSYIHLVLEEACERV